MRSDAEEEQYSDLLMLIDMLSSLLSKDFMADLTAIGGELAKLLTYFTLTKPFLRISPLCESLLNWCLDKTWSVIGACRRWCGRLVSGGGDDGERGRRGRLRPEHHGAADERRDAQVPRALLLLHEAHHAPVGALPGQSLQHVRRSARQSLRVDRAGLDVKVSL